MSRTGTQPGAELEAAERSNHRVSLLMGQHTHTAARATPAGTSALIAPRQSASTDAPGAASAQARTEWLPLAGMQLHLQAWQALAERALEPNVFYEPAFALAAADVFGRDVGSLLVWSTCEPARLIGFFPTRIERRRYGLGPAILTGWTHPFAPLGVPLVDRDHAAEAIAGWLDADDGATQLPKLRLLPLLPDGPFAAALRAELAARGGTETAFNRHERALLKPDRERDAYLERALSSKKRKELRRQRRHLEQHGVVAVRTMSAATDMAAAVAIFMRLEERGWKGKAGTAVAQNPALSRFMLNAVNGLAETQQARVACLMAGDKPVAAGITLRSGACGWFWKIAFDEDFARASPGVQLTLDITQSLLADRHIASVDSCATSDHPMIDHIWRERLRMSDLLIAPDADAPRALAFAAALERARRSAIRSAKWMRDRLRGR